MILSFLAWSLFGVLFGLIALIRLAAVNPSVRPENLPLLASQLAALYGLFFGFLGIAVFTAGWVLHRFAPSLSPARAFRFRVLGALVGSTTIAAGMILVVGAAPRLLMAALALGAATVISVVVDDRWRMPAAASVVLVVLAIGASLSLLAFGRPANLPADAVALPPQTISRQVILIGVDGADWRQLDRLAADARIPTFTRLSESGVRAPLRTTIPTWSPIVWNSVSTGVGADMHGIHDFSETPLPGLPCGLQSLRRDNALPSHTGLKALSRALFASGWLHERPISSCHRRVKAIWNLVSEVEGTAAVVNWFASWPSEQLGGYVVSDHNPARAAFVERQYSANSSSTAGVTYPERFIDELAELDLPELPATPTDLVAMDLFADTSRGERDALASNTALMDAFKTIYSSDTFSAAAARYLLEIDDIDFLAVYLSGIDNLSHRFGRVPGVVDRYYERADELIASILEVAREDAVVLIVSDHGWEYDYAGGNIAHDRGPDGIVILNGPGVRRGHRLAESPSIFDIAPTAIALMGLPASDDLVGSPIRNALMEATWRELPKGTVSTYGGYDAPSMSDLAATSDELSDETMKKLRALGYIR